MWRGPQTPMGGMEAGRMTPPPYNSSWPPLLHSPPSHSRRVSFSHSHTTKQMSERWAIACPRQYSPQQLLVCPPYHKHSSPSRSHSFQSNPLHVQLQSGLRSPLQQRIVRGVSQPHPSLLLRSFRKLLLKPRPRLCQAESSWWGGPTR